MLQNASVVHCRFRWLKFLPQFMLRLFGSVLSTPFLTTLLCKWGTHLQLWGVLLGGLIWCFHSSQRNQLSSWHFTCTACSLNVIKGRQSLKNKEVLNTAPQRSAWRFNISQGTFPAFLHEAWSGKVLPRSVQRKRGEKNRHCLKRWAAI